MPDADSLMVHGTTLEVLQSQPGPSKRTRPPNIDTVSAQENRVPLRPEKANKRESRLGLRNLFSRSKTSKEVETPLSLPHEISNSKSGGARASVADAGNWPYVSSAHKSESTLNPIQSSRTLPITLESPPMVRTPHSYYSNGGKYGTIEPPMSPRGPLATWSPPSLFKAYPQAIKHITLPATSLSADTVLRIYEKKTNTTAREDPAEPKPAPPPAQNGDGDKEKLRRRHRRNSSWSTHRFDWTNKIYILATSGYLLQYAAEGAFDRLPEKVLQLGSNSAAFASDVIPGRHWVIHVSSAMESDGAANQDSKSLFSRFRVTERRQASNFLMVFESAQDMEDWIVTLRREIQLLGGKKTLSETGKPKDDGATMLKQQTSQRTLVVRDPARFSRILSPPELWDEHASQNGTPTLQIAREAVRDRSLDDLSVTNSVVSQDGKQLDNLRDGPNRLSFVSTGQRTAVTSAGSSPACSPIVDQFLGHWDELPNNSETRLRPNASAILDRRQSMQTMVPVPFVELRGKPRNFRPQSTLGSKQSSDRLPLPIRTATPNFSVPQSSNRRYSYARQGPPEGDHAPRQPARKPPPTKLSLARPLSMVADQPSPMEAVPERPATRHGESLPRSPARYENLPLPPIPQPFNMPPRQPIGQAFDEHPGAAGAPGSRRLSTSRPMRGHDKPPLSRNFTAPQQNAPFVKQRSSPCLSKSEEMERRRSSLDVFGGRGETTTPRSLKRASTQSIMSDRSSLYKSAGDFPLHFIVEPPFQTSPPPSAPLPPIPTSASSSHLRLDSVDKGLFNRQSMPQLNDGPPPVPPPTCALPPIPKKGSIKF